MTEGQHLSFIWDGEADIGLVTEITDTEVTVQFNDESMTYNKQTLEEFQEEGRLEIKVCEKLK